MGHLTTRLPRDLEVAGQMLTTRKWWDESRSRFELYTSEATVVEASRGDREAAKSRLDAIIGITLLPVSRDVFALTQLLLSSNALPAKARMDAFHVAIAATNSVEFLLTWNCKHLANAILRTKIEQACTDQGFKAPIICTPVELQEVYP